jgi:hypothetical protein
MAINPRYVDTITQGFKEIFNEWRTTLVDLKEDGGYESISIQVKRISSSQYKQLQELTVKVPNSFYIDHEPEGMRLIFF